MAIYECPVNCRANFKPPREAEPIASRSGWLVDGERAVKDCDIYNQRARQFGWKRRAFVTIITGLCKAEVTVRRAQDIINRSPENDDAYELDCVVSEEFHRGDEAVSIRLEFDTWLCYGYAHFKKTHGRRMRRGIA